MILSDLVSELREGMLGDKTDRVAGTSDYLWTDARLILYINEAQRRFAVQGLVLRDARTPECCQLTIVAGQSDYTLHESVFGVVSARLSTATADIPRVGHSLLSAYRPASESWADTSTYASMTPGPPLAFATDEGLSDELTDSLSQVSLKLYPVPSAAQDGLLIQLRVVRKPIEQLTPQSLGASPEIPEDHHIEMLDWAAYLALRVVDDDAGNQPLAASFAASFTTHVNNARNTAMRKMFAPLPWGFGRGGFTWGS